jgi:hypothetical protein
MIMLLTLVLSLLVFIDEGEGDSQTTDFNANSEATVESDEKGNEGKEIGISGSGEESKLKSVNCEKWEMWLIECFVGLTCGY